MTAISHISHISAQPLYWDGRYVRQRCAWCGAILIDMDLATIAVPIPEDGSDPEPPGTWPVNATIRVDGMVTYVVPDETSEDGKGIRPPDDACLRLDPTVTR